MGPEAKKSTLFIWHILLSYIEKDPCTIFCGVMIFFFSKSWSYKVLKSAYVTSYPKHFTSNFLCIFKKKEPSTTFHDFLQRSTTFNNFLKRFMVFLTIFHEHMKLQSFGWLNCVLTLVTSSTLMNTHNQQHTMILLLLVNLI